MKRALLTGVLTAGTIASLAAATPGAAAVQANGEGWSAAIQHQTGPEDDQGRLVMVRPEGGIVPVGDVSDDARILDVSADGKHVLTARDQSDQTRVTVWDISSKQPSYFRIAANSADLSFGGGGIVQAPREKASGTVTVRGYDGSPKNTYPASALNSGRTYRSSAVSPDGKHLIEAADKIVVRDAATGSVVTSINHPEKQTAKRRCNIQRAWGVAAVGVQCSDTDGIGNEDAYRVPFDGVASHVASTPSEVLPTSSGVVYDSRGVNGPSLWVLKNASGERELPFGEYSDVTGSLGERVYVASSPYDPAKGSTLFTYDVNSGARTNLAGTKETGGGLITDAQTIDGNQ